MSTSTRLRQLIKALGSQAAVARALGVSGQHIKEVLQGRREPSPRLSANCDALADMLKGGDDA